MTNFDPTLHPRGANPANRGQFSERQRTDAEATLADGFPLLDRRPNGLDPHQLRMRDQFAVTLAALDGSPDGATDLFVGSVLNGHLSRGTPGRDGVAALQEWRRIAFNGGGYEHQDFLRGLDHAVVALMREKTHLRDTPLIDNSGAIDPSATTEAMKFAATHRASANDRMLWARRLQNTSEHEWRGMLVAGAALSGTDQWWGFRDNPERTILGD